MSEATTQAAENPTPQPISRNPYPLDAPEYKMVFPVRWSGPDGRIDVTHVLRRPTIDQLTAYKQQTVVERRYNAEGDMIGESVDLGTAAQSLWDEIAISVDGYPGLNSGAPLSVTDDIRRKMRSSHKERAIEHLLAADVTILEAESNIMFEGGEWAVRLDLGKADRPHHSIKLRFREWDEREKRDFQRNRGAKKSKQEGKTMLTRASANLPAFVKLFDAIFLNCEGATVGDQSFAESRRAEFLDKDRGFLAEYKIIVITAIVNEWERSFSD